MDDTNARIDEICAQIDRDDLAELGYRLARLLLSAYRATVDEQAPQLRVPEAA